MLAAILLKGVIIGFSLAAPVGPVGIMCIRRTLTHGHLRGFVSGLGAAAADSVYAIVAAFGITLISNFIVRQEIWIRLIGGILLLVLGTRTLLHHPQEREPKVGINGHASAFVSMFFLTFTNPMTLFAFAVVFAGLGAGSVVDDTLTASFLVAGVFCGSGLWFLFITSAVHFYKDKFKQRGLKIVNIVAGCFIILCGLIALLSFRALYLAR
jgi:threonine/homoserine/homoserine lactone efflux protein